MTFTPSPRLALPLAALLALPLLGQSECEPPTAQFSVAHSDDVTALFRFKGISERPEGGYIATGRVDYIGACDLYTCSHDYHSLVVSVSEAGQVEWEDRPDTIEFYDVAALAGGGAIAVGAGCRVATYPPGVQSARLSRPCEGYLYGITPLTGGGAAAVGDTRFGGSEAPAGVLLLLRFDGGGDLEWAQRIPIAEAVAVVVTDVAEIRGEIVATGWGTFEPSGEHRGFVARLTQEGALIDTLSVPDDCFQGVAGTADGFILSGGGPDCSGWQDTVYVTRLTEAGDRVWERTYGTANVWYGSGMSISATGPDSYVVATNTEGEEAGNDGRLIHLDGQGDILWDRHYGGQRDDRFYRAQVTSDGGIVAVGELGNVIGRPAAWILKLDAQGMGPETY